MDITSVEDALRLVREDACALIDMPENLRTAEVCLAAARQNGFFTLRFLPEKRKTAEVCLAAVTQNGNAFRYVPKKLRTPELRAAAEPTITYQDDEIRFIDDEPESEKILTPRG
jgi:hypothetical protein